MYQVDKNSPPNHMTELIWAEIVATAPAILLA